MVDPKHYYEILELEVGAPADAVKEAYRDLAQVWHPDRFANSPRLKQKAQEKMKEINEAYDFLKTYSPPAAGSRHAPQPEKPQRASHTSERPQPRPAAAAAGGNSAQNRQDEIWTMRGHTDIVSSVAFAPTGKLVVSGSYDKTARIWQTGTGLEKSWLLGHKSAVTSVAFGPDSRGVVSGGMDKSIFLRDCDTKREIQYFYAGAVVQCLAISPDGRYLLSGTVGSGTILWETSSGRELRRFNVGGFVSTVCFSPRGNRLAIGTSDGDVSIIDRLDGAIMLSFRVMRDAAGQMVEAVKFSRDGSYLLTASQYQLQLWNAGSGQESGRLETGPSTLSCADISPDGTRAVTGHADATVRLWDLALGTQRHGYTGHTGAVRSVAFAADGASIVSGSFDKTVRLWRVRE